jgi:hypothetical protein
MTTKAKPQLPVKKGFDRFDRAPMTEKLTIDRTGGKFGAGIIRNVSLASYGEALGHDYWIDQVTLMQIEALSKKASGLKSRFTHPGMSSDGMGRYLGRIMDIRKDGDQVYGDLHFAKSAHDTPDGDLAEYVMTLAEEDPQAAGLSIVFEHNIDAESDFEIQFSGREGFKSPDAANVDNYPHVRIKEMRAADIVDEPAANPNGLFDRESLPRDVDALLSFAAGISDSKPHTECFGVDADRASQFLARWLDSHGLSLTRKEDKQLSDKTENAEPVTVAPTRDQFAAELKAFTDKFGAENGVKWFGENKSFAEALELHCEELSSQLAAAQAKADSAEARLKSLSLGEKEPIAVGATDSAKPKKTFAQAVGAK